ncbi:hypothetical protein VTH82DRAFT_3454 [Thermothelomyces myriococcoides]
MSSFELLQERLTALQETTAQLRELIDRLANVQFQPGSVPLGASDEDNVATELSTEINQILREEEEDLELLQEEITDLRSGRPGSEAEHRKTRLKDGAQRLQADLRDCRTSFRKAQLSARRSLEAARKLERDLLLSSYTAAAAAAAAASASASVSSSAILSNPDNGGGGSSSSITTNPPDSQLQPGPTTSAPQSPPQPPLSFEEARNQLLTPRNRRRQQQQQKSRSTGGDGGADAAVAASDDITQALRRTHALIAGELAKSAFAARTLAESTAALAELQRSYEGLDGLLARSRDLVGALVSAHKSDTWYLQAALRILLATLAWLLFRRLLYGPLWWLLWLPLRTGWRVTSKGVGYLASDGGVGVGISSSSSSSIISISSPTIALGEEGTVPTVSIGLGETKEERKTEGEEGEEESMVDQVGRMVEDTLNRKDEMEEKEEREGEGEAVNRTTTDDLEDRPNPKKRMWEEGVGERAEGQVRDEL